MDHTKAARRRAAIAAALILGSAGPAAASPAFQVENPLWSINVTARGYSDFLVENDQLYLREYLSGEWGAAVSWSGSPGGEAIWFEPDWIFPDWTTNSNFLGLTQDFSSFDGGKTFTSTFDNGVLSVTQILEMVDTAALAGGPGVAQGTSPASAGGAGSSSPSNPYVLKHTYMVRNVSGSPLGDVRFFQFLHGLNATEGVYDDRLHAGAFPEYRYDVTQWGRVSAIIDLDVPFEDPGRSLAASGFQFFFDAGGTDDDIRMLLGMSAEDVDQWFLDNLGFSSPSLATFFSSADAYQINEDVIAFHAAVAPDGFELGEYGKPANSDHEVGKPPSGVHLSVESGSLDGISDQKTPDGLWVGGALQYDWGTLAPDETRQIDFLLSISTAQDLFLAPEPEAVPLGAATLAALAGLCRGHGSRAAARTPRRGDSQRRPQGPDGRRLAGASSIRSGTLRPRQS